MLNSQHHVASGSGPCLFQSVTRQLARSSSARTQVCESKDHLIQHNLHVRGPAKRYIMSLT